MAIASATAQTSRGPCITLLGRLWRSSVADNAHDNPFQLFVRIVRSSLLVQFRHPGEELLRPCRVPHFPIRLPELIESSGVIRIERCRPFQLLDGLLGVATPQQRLAELRTRTSECGIEPDGLLEGANRLRAVRRR